MSHRDDCPTPSEARRRGERDYNNGSQSNPFRDCPEASRAWRSGQFQAEDKRMEEERERAEYERQRDEQEAL